jgi:hypothetical protein
VGVDGQPVFLLSNDGLSATVSKIQHPHISYNISWLLAYKQVIEAFHNDLAIGGVIPMRYGYLFKERSQVTRLLKERSKQYKALLKELEGCVEMGIRILISECGMRNAECGPPWPPARSLRLGKRDSSVKRSNADKDLEGKLGTLGPPKTGLPAIWQAGLGLGLRNAEYESQKLRTPQSAIRNPQSVAPGQAYLAARKAHYSQQETFSKEMCRVINRCREAFAGLFVKCKAEVPSIANFQFSIRNPWPRPDPQVQQPFPMSGPNHRVNHDRTVTSRQGGPQSTIHNPFPSLYFLVQKGAVDPFRKAFRHIHSNGSARLLLSGPWPPYNFVQPEYNDRNESMIGGIE